MANTQIQIKTNGTTTLATAGKYCDRNIDVNVAVPASGITPSGSKAITTNGTHDVTQYANAIVNVPTGITPTGSKTITENGTHDVTNYASAVVDVPTAQPTQFTNYYDPSLVRIGERSSYSSSAGYKITTDSECNTIRIPYHHAAGSPFSMRMRGISTVRSRLNFICFAEDGETVPANGSFSSYFTVSYDEHGDAVLTLTGTPLSKEWYFIELIVQYIGIGNATTALTGPIITINEPIGNGGHA